MTQQPSARIEIEVTDEDISGTVALGVAPGTPAAKRDSLLDEVLTERLDDAAKQMRVVLAADPHAYAHPKPGLDDEGRTVFQIKGRVEGDLLVPVRAGKRRR